MSEIDMQQTAESAATNTDINVLRRHNPDDLIPERLSGDLNLAAIEEVHNVEHREATLDMNRFINHLSAGLENKAIMKGDTSDPSEISEYEAFQSVLGWMESYYPALFGDEEAIEALGRTTIVSTDIHTIDISEDYWAGVLCSDFVCQNTSEDHLRIVLPAVAIFAQYVREQISSDREKTVRHAKRDIRQAVISNAVGYDLDTDQIEEAVEDAFDDLTTHSLLD